MSWIEDARKLLQDFVAPELRSINQRIDDLLQQMKSGFDLVEKLAAERDKSATDRQQAVLEKLESTRRELTLQIELALAMRKIEELQGKHQQAH